MKLLKKYSKHGKLFFALVLGVLVAVAGVWVVSTLQNNDATMPIEQVQTQNIDIELEGKISDWAKSRPGDYGVVVREISGNERQAFYQADKKFVTASIYKLFLSYAALSWVERGQLEPGTTVDSSSNIDSCIDSLIVYSNAACAWPMGNLVGWAEIQNFLHEQGFKSTEINNYDSDGNFVGEKYSTPADVAELGLRLSKGALLNRTNTEAMLNRMKEQIWRERIPSGLPENVVVANKPGWLPGIDNDVAIVYGENSTYILVIMSENSGAEYLTELSEIVYRHLNS